ncbi:MAG: hydrogenase nickel incorporation protein HypB [Oscillospiraceae bacterium]|nr:hydrogenase nickel incorporation protein HypB [Oscillospiraceae bacterium]MBR0451070.1 hydrogenase nickel incorporation protein HypB [Oscillospiraceae bacterium]
MQIIELKESVTASNDRDAEIIREKLKENGTFLANIMSSPGSGKTTLLSRTIIDLSGSYKIGVIEADIASSVDAERIEALGARSVQVHTDGMCHMDAGMTLTGLEALNYPDLDLVFLENVGNLICPAEFDTGASKSVMILSVPEGDDKPLKYPLMFSVSDLILVTKTDTLPYFNFDLEKCRQRILRLNPNAQVIPVSAKTGENMDAWYDWLKTETKNCK